MGQYILTAEHIQKKYDGQTVLHDVSIHVKQGDIYGLIGKNGSGKTTLFRILTGLIQEYGGTVSISNIDNRASRASAVINSPSLFLNMNAFENMKEQSYLLGMRGEGKIKQVLETVGLAYSNKKLVKNFSLGMTQRLKLAMALLESPDILILDEPANGLDPDGIAELRALLLRLNRTSGITILISSHILSELAQIVTCLGILHNGEIVKELSAHDILQNGTNLEKLYMQYTKGGNSHG
ncbi:MAG: ATP-binding cassette domain-containing protein [Clostridiales bacterium]|jgi:ABC-type multidrug transport system ATPase subunit|nr:ATP-binding cassette domain-containing protein [Clostridiales bacterium]